MNTEEIRCERVRYEGLNARQKELFNFQKVAATLADYGFNCIKLADDWQGADFLAYHFNGDRTLKVQLKSRLTIQERYRGKQIWIAFPYKHPSKSEKLAIWYVIRHDDLVDKVGKHTNWLGTDSWKLRGIYSSTSANPGLLESLAENNLGPVYGDVLAADDDEGARAAAI
jgi:hypothetical protein